MWLFQVPNVLDQVVDNLQTLDVTLTDEEIKHIESIFPVENNA